MKYTLPRLVEKDTMMSRLTGGIGGRGPGETKLEINRRRAEDRITKLEKEIGLLSKKKISKKKSEKKSQYSYNFYSRLYKCRQKHSFE